MDNEKYYEMAIPYIKEVIHKDLDLYKIADLVKSRIETFLDIKDLIDFFEELPEYDTAMYTHKKMKTNEEISLGVLKEQLPLLEALEDYSIPAIEEVVMNYIGQ